MAEGHKTSSRDVYLESSKISSKGTTKKYLGVEQYILTR